MKIAAQDIRDLAASAELIYTIRKKRALVCGIGDDAGGPNPYQVVAQ